ncbi:uncharacterized protein LOC143229227 isoform X2 [Tachypleus tridentatus]|uniref:uncharacterized protein LOC143229227 isoform X2 n=1 Tax=Tachypleus tridentatus TaxID=6853 RepID=UPI003FD5C5EE
MLLFHGERQGDKIMLEKIPFSTTGGEEQELATTVLTCEGDLEDPAFSYRLCLLVSKLQTLISDEEKPFHVTKVEPWNSVRVTFSIPHEAAQRLRQLAQRGDHVLRELGILSVQIEGDQVITLTLAGHYNDSHEIVFCKNSNSPTAQLSNSPSVACDATSLEGSPGPSNAEITRKNIAHYLSQQGSMASVAAGTSASSSLIPAEESTSVDLHLQSSMSFVSRNASFKSPNVVAPATNEPIPFLQTNVAGSSRGTHLNQAWTQSSFGPFPFASMTHAMTAKHAVLQHGQGNATHLTLGSSSHPNLTVLKASPKSSAGSFQAGTCGIYKQSSPHPPTVFSNLVSHVSTLLPSTSNSTRANVALSSPLLVNLLQNDGQQGQQHTNLLMPPPAVDVKQLPKRKRKPRKPKEKLNKEDTVLTGENNPEVSLSFSKSVSLFGQNTNVTTMCNQSLPSTSSNYENLGVLNSMSFSLSLPNIPLSPPISTFPIIHPQAQGQPQVHTGNLSFSTHIGSPHVSRSVISTALNKTVHQDTKNMCTELQEPCKPPESVLVSEPNYLPSPPPSSEGKIKHLINPFTGQLEPMPSDEEEEESIGSLPSFPEFEMETFENGQSEQSPSDDGKDNNLLSDTDSGISKSLTDVSQSPETNPETETNIHSTKVVLRGDSGVASNSPGEMLKLRLKLDPKTLREAKESENKEKKGKIEKDSGYSSQSPHKIDVSFVSIPSLKKTGLMSSSEPRVPPLHISLRGPNAAVVISPKKEENKAKFSASSMETHSIALADSMSILKNCHLPRSLQITDDIEMGSRKCNRSEMFSKSGCSVPVSTVCLQSNMNQLVKSEPSISLNTKLSETSVMYSETSKVSIESLSVSCVSSSVLTVSSVKVPHPNVTACVQTPSNIEKLSRTDEQLTMPQQHFSSDSVLLPTPSSSDVSSTNQTTKTQTLLADTSFLSAIGLPVTCKKTALIKEDITACEEKSKLLPVEHCTNLPQSSDRRLTPHNTCLSEDQLQSVVSASHSAVTSKYNSSQPTVSEVVMATSVVSGLPTLVDSTSVIDTKQHGERLGDPKEYQKTLTVSKNEEIKKCEQNDIEKSTEEKVANTKHAKLVLSEALGNNCDGVDNSKQEADEITNGQPQGLSSSSLDFDPQSYTHLSSDIHNTGPPVVMTSRSLNAYRTDSLDGKDQANGPSLVSSLDNQEIVKSSDDVCHKELKTSYQHIGLVNSSASVLNCYQPTNYHERLGDSLLDIHCSSKAESLRFVEVRRNTSSPVARILTLDSGTPVSSLSKWIEVPSVGELSRITSVGRKTQFQGEPGLPTLVSSRGDGHVHEGLDVSFAQDNKDEVNTNSITSVKSILASVSSSHIYSTSNQLSSRVQSLMPESNEVLQHEFQNKQTLDPPVTNLSLIAQNIDNPDSQKERTKEDCDSTVPSDESSMDSIDEGTARNTIAVSKGACSSVMDEVAKNVNFTSKSPSNIQTLKMENNDGEAKALQQHYIVQPNHDTDVCSTSTELISQEEQSDKKGLENDTLNTSIKPVMKELVEKTSSSFQSSEIPKSSTPDESYHKDDDNLALSSISTKLIQSAASVICPILQSSMSQSASQNVIQQPSTASCTHYDSSMPLKSHQSNSLTELVTCTTSAANIQSCTFSVSDLDNLTENTINNTTCAPSSSSAALDPCLVEQRTSSHPYTGGTNSTPVSASSALFHCAEHNVISTTCFSNTANSQTLVASKQLNPDTTVSTADNEETSNCHLVAESSQPSVVITTGSVVTEPSSNQQGVATCMQPTVITVSASVSPEQTHTLVPSNFLKKCTSLQKEAEASESSFITEVVSVPVDMSTAYHPVVTSVASTPVTSLPFISSKLSSCITDTPGSRLTLIFKNTLSSGGQRSLLTSANNMARVSVPFNSSKTVPIKFVTLPTGGSPLKTVKSSNLSVLELISSSSSSTSTVCLTTSSSLSTSPVRLLVSHMKPSGSSSSLSGTSSMVNKVLVKSVVVTNTSPSIKLVPMRGTICTSSTAGSGSLLAVSSNSSLIQESSRANLSSKVTAFIPSSMLDLSKQSCDGKTVVDQSQPLETKHCVEPQSLKDCKLSVHCVNSQNVIKKEQKNTEAAVDFNTEQEILLSIPNCSAHSDTYTTTADIQENSAKIISNTDHMPSAKLTYTKDISEDHCYTCNQSNVSSQSSGIEKKVFEDYLNDGKKDSLITGTHKEQTTCASCDFLAKTEPYLPSEHITPSEENGQNCEIQNETGVCCQSVSEESTGTYQELKEEPLNYIVSDSSAMKENCLSVIVSTDSLANNIDSQTMFTKTVPETKTNPELGVSDQETGKKHRKELGHMVLEPIRPVHISLKGSSANDENLEDGPLTEVFDLRSHEKSDKREIKVQVNKDENVTVDEMCEDKDLINDDQGNKEEAVYLKSLKRKCSENTVDLIKVCIEQENNFKGVVVGKLKASEEQCLTKPQEDDEEEKETDDKQDFSLQKLHGLMHEDFIKKENETLDGSSEDEIILHELANCSNVRQKCVPGGKNVFVHTHELRGSRQYPKVIEKGDAQIEQASSQASRRSSSNESKTSEEPRGQSGHRKDIGKVGQKEHSSRDIYRNSRGKDCENSSSREEANELTPEKRKTRGSNILEQEVPPLKRRRSSHDSHR